MISFSSILITAKRRSYLWLTLIFLPIQCMIRTQPIEKSGYLFIKSLIDSNTGLVRDPAVELTTIYQNALVAMVLIHEGDIKAAEQMLSHFQKYYLLNRDSFHGLPQNWNPKTGLPDTSSIHWEGDAAFLLLVLNYYAQISGDSDRFHDVTSGLLVWLSQQANSCNLIVAEGVAEMYAALAPFESDFSVQISLARLHQCFFSHGSICSKDYQQNLSHIIRGALVFGDPTGFSYLDNFVQCHSVHSISPEKLIGYSSFAGTQKINTAVTAQILLALKIWQQDRQFKAWSLCQKIVQTICNRQNQLFEPPDSMHHNRLNQIYESCLLTSACYLMFTCWHFNPFALGKECAVDLMVSNKKTH